jgi:hypothetical protein
VTAYLRKYPANDALSAMYELVGCRRVQEQAEKIINTNGRQPDFGTMGLPIGGYG